MNIERESPIKKAFKTLLQKKLAIISLIFLIFLIIAVISAPVLTKYKPEDVDAAMRLVPGFWNSKVSGGHILGTDHLGRDVFSRLLYGGRVSLSVGFISTAIGLIFGVSLGLIAGYYKKLDNVIMRFMDLLFTFPGILLAMLIIAMLGVSTVNTTIAIAIWSIPNFARMTRSKVLSVKEEDYIMAIKSLGAKDSRIIIKHILPNVLPVIIVVATMRIGASIMSIATLSYLGLGTPAPNPEWGGMIATAKDYMWQAPSLIIIPGFVVMLTVIAFNILGDKLRDILDPSLKDAQ